MSLLIARLNEQKRTAKSRSRAQLLALVPPLVYDDGRTKQSFKDETDINKIMARFSVTGTISHLEKFQGIYADFSDFDFHEQTTKLTRGREIFDELPAELRKEFAQSPAAFFAYVNDPANADDLRKKLPALGAPGQQLIKTSPPLADDKPVDPPVDPPAEPPADPPASS